MIKSIIIVAIVVAVATTAQSQPLPTGAPESAGMSSERLLRIDAFFANLNWAVLDKRWQAARKVA